MAQPAPKPKPGGGKRGLQSRLTAKVGPLPVWLWAAAILGVYLLYTRLHSSTAAAAPAAATSTDTTSTDTSGTPGSAGFDQVQAAIDANTASLDSLTAGLLSTPATDAAPIDNGAPPGASSQTGPATQPTPPPATKAAAAGHLTQTAAGSLQWGGVTFTTKAAFNRWASAHGTSPAKEFAAHPQAKAIYSTLK